jgi:hypothetical protein
MWFPSLLHVIPDTGFPIALAILVNPFFGEFSRLVKPLHGTYGKPLTLIHINAHPGVQFLGLMIMFWV